MKNQDHPGVRIPPPLIFLSFGILGVLLNNFLPLGYHLPGISEYIGFGIMTFTIFGMFCLIGYFKKHQTEIEPWKTTSTIITSGPYRYSRNPVYVLMCGIPIGLGLIYDSYWAIISFIPALVTVYFIAVKKEEAYLEDKFGQEYLDYKKKVRRWL